MLKAAVINDQDRILDLGCGYGFVGIYLAKGILKQQLQWQTFQQMPSTWLQKCATNDVAPEIVLSEGFKEISDKTFDVILSNPPYHVDFLYQRNLSKAYRQLALNGKLYMVTKRRKWYENKIRSVFGYVKSQKLTTITYFTQKSGRKIR